MNVDLTHDELDHLIALLDRDDDTRSLHLADRLTAHRTDSTALGALAGNTNDTIFGGHRTIYRQTVLTYGTPASSDTGDVGFGAVPVDYRCNEGDAVGHWEVVAVERLTRTEMTDALVEAGNDGSFFDDEWEDVDDDE